MTLGSTNRVQFQLVLLRGLVGRAEVVGVSVGPGALVEAVARLTHQRTRNRQFLADHTGVKTNRRLQEVPAAQLLTDVTAFGASCRVRNDVDGSTDRGSSQVHTRQTALNLDVARSVTHTVPVRPVYPTVLHVIHGHTVDHDRNVTLVESTNVQTRVARTTTLVGRID